MNLQNGETHNLTIFSTLENLCHFDIILDNIYKLYYKKEKTIPTKSKLYVLWRPMIAHGLSLYQFALIVFFFGSVDWLHLELHLMDFQIEPNFFHF